MSIRTKFILILVAFIIIPDLLFNVLVFSTTKASLMDVRIAQLNNIAVLKKDKIETFFNVWKSEIQLAKQNPDIRQFLPLLIAHSGDRSSTTYRQAAVELRDQLRVIQEVNGYLNVLLTDARGRIVLSSNGRQDDPLPGSLPSVKYFLEARNDIFFSDIYRRSSGDQPLAMIAAAPVHDIKGNFIGEVVIEQGMDQIYRSITDTTGLGRTGEVVISRREGDAVLFLNPLKDDPYAAFTKKVAYYDLRAYPSQRASQGETGSGIAYDYNKMTVLAAWQYLPSLRWGLVTKMDTTEAFAPVMRLRNQIVVLGSIILVLAIFVAVATARGITDPILALQKGTSMIGGGNLDHKVGTQAKDEVGDLSRLIDAMSGNLKKITASRDELNAEIVVRKQAENSLVEQSRVLEAYFKHSFAPLVFLDREFNFLRVNEAYARVCSRDVEDFRGHNHFVDYPSDELKQKFEGVVATGQPYYVYARPFAFPEHPEWGISYWDIIVNPILGDDGNVAVLVFSLSDVTERRESERRRELTSDILNLFARKSTRKEYLDAVIDRVHAWSGCSHAGIRITGQDGSIPFESYVGYDQSFIGQEGCISLGKDDCICTRIISEAPAVTDRAFLTKSVSFVTNDASRFLDGMTSEERQRYRATCLRRGYASLAVIPIRYREAVIGALHVADQQPDRMPARNVESLEQISVIIGEAVYRFGIEEERARLVSAVESAAEAVVITEPASGVIVYANPAFEQMTGYGEDEITGRTLHFLESGKLGDEYYTKLRETLATDGVWNGRLINQRKNGALYYEDCTVSPVKDSKGEIINYVYIKRDVTEKLRLETIAESVNTMNNIGYVFSGVRHEIGNPINSIAMILDILRAKQDTLAPEAIKDYLAKMTEQVDRVEYIFRSLKSFNLYETQEPQNIDLSYFLENFLPLIKDDLGKKGIAIEAAVEPDITAFADSRALQQVLLNIVTNAADAVSDRENPRIAFSLSRRDGSVQIRVQDNGQGIPEEKMKDIFKPFYTTKKHGTGLGLVIVKKMLSRMNGNIGLTSRSGEGTIVDISLQEATSEEQ